MRISHPRCKLTVKYGYSGLSGYRLKTTITIRDVTVLDAPNVGHEADFTAARSLTLLYNVTERHSTV